MKLKELFGEKEENENTKEEELRKLKEEKMTGEKEK